MATAGALNHRTDCFRLLIAHVGAINAAISGVNDGRSGSLILFYFFRSELVTIKKLFHPARRLDKGLYRLLVIVIDEKLV